MNCSKGTGNKHEDCYGTFKKYMEGSENTESNYFKEISSLA